MNTAHEPFMHLAPFVVEKLWGGHKLASMKGLATTSAVGETWEVSTLREGPSLFQGQALCELIPDLKYLIKLIDTTDYLSVQVHPGDEYAAKVENSGGKTECWFILSSEPGAGIYLGFKTGIDKRTFVAAIEAKADLSQFLRFYPVKTGDFFYVPAGSIHAIGKGVTLAEVQQSSGITYRVWDWDRVDKDGKARTLDVKKALDVLNFAPECNEPTYFRHAHNVFHQSQMNFLSHPDFHVSVIRLAAKEIVTLPLSREYIYSCLNLKGKVELSLNGKKSWLPDHASVIVHPGLEGALMLQAPAEALLLVVR